MTDGTRQTTEGKRQIDGLTWMLSAIWRLASATWRLASAPRRLPSAVCCLLSAFCLLLYCSRPTRPNIILISIDTLRADHVDARRTPHLVALERDSLVAEAWSHCPLTLPSHVSILTGLLPPEHGVRDNAGYRFDVRAHPTVASLLRANGYHTGAAVSAWVLRGATGISEGFESYDDAIGMVEGAPAGALQRDGNATEQIAEQWIAKQGREPFFYFLHLYEPHTPYTPSYDADVTKADAIAGRLLDFLKRTGRYDDALVIVLSDHGEGLMDHGEQEHGVFLYREALAVPLIVKLPRASRRGTIANRAQLVDVAPTILEAAGISAKTSGVSLLRPPTARASYAESLYPRIHLGWSELQSLARSNIHYIAAPRPELYDLASDPRERTNALEQHRRDYASLRDALAGFGSSFTAPERISAEDAKKLASLGYVSAGTEATGPLPDPKDRVGDLAKLKSGSIDELASLVAANPRWSDARDQLGAALSARGDHERAAKVYEDGITATPSLAADFARSAASELFDLNCLDDAEAHARFAADHDAPGAHLLLGEIALARSDFARAGAEAANAQRVADERPHALFLQAKVAAAQHQYEEALRLLVESDRERVRLHASEPEHFHYVAGDTLAELGRMEEAKRELELELVRDPGNVRARESLQIVQRVLGHGSAVNPLVTR